MRVRYAFKAMAVGAAAALLATACAGDDGDDPENGGNGGGALRAYLSEPDSLIPSNGTDSESNQVITEIYRGLTSNSVEGGAELAVAESIESEDNITWDVQLKQDYAFTNGEPVDADAFIRAWNYAAYGPNAQTGAGFYERIVGFEEMQADPPEAEELAGLTKTGDFSFTVELSAPFAGFAETVAYQPFYPLAQECLDDIDTCNEQPISNGPYQLEEPWQHDESVTLVKNENYPGDDAGVPDRIEFRILESIEAAYAEFQGGGLDMVDGVPPERLAEAEAQFADGLYQTPNNSLTFIGIPKYDERFEDPRLIQAFSMAIDRQAIIDAVLNGAATPATGWVSPLFEGQRDGVCWFCEYNPEEAQQLFDDAGGFDDTLELTANAGAGHEDWLQAVGDQLQQNLGIEYSIDVSQQFAEYLGTLRDEQATGPFRLGWGPDYAIMETYMTHLYVTGQSSNYYGYSNEDVDQFIAEGDQAATVEDGIRYYQQAEDALADDPPNIPMWWGEQNVLYNPDVVEEIGFNPIDYEDYGQTQLTTG